VWFLRQQLKLLWVALQTFPKVETLFRPKDRVRKTRSFRQVEVSLGHEKYSDWQERGAQDNAGDT
jgi:hypothetical protein